MKHFTASLRTWGEAAGGVCEGFGGGGFVEAGGADGGEAGLLDLVGDCDGFLGAVVADLPEFVAGVYDFDFLQFQLDLVAGDGAHEVVDLRVIAEQAAVGDLQDVVGPRAGDRVDLAAEVEINAEFLHRLPQRRVGAAFEHQAA